MAQIAAGESVLLLPIVDHLRANADWIEAEHCVSAHGEGFLPGRDLTFAYNRRAGGGFCGSPGGSGQSGLPRDKLANIWVMLQ